MNQDEIREWLADNVEGLAPELWLSPEALDHVAMCMHHIYQWYTEGRPLGDFLTAVVQDKFAEACVRADDVNRKALYFYAIFCANKIGSDYRDKALGKKGGESWLIP